MTRADRPTDRAVTNAVQLLAGGAVLSLLALALVELRPARWSEVSLTSIGAGFLLVFDSLIGFMLYTRLLASAPAPLVSTYACVTPIVGAALVLTAVALELRAG